MVAQSRCAEYAVAPSPRTELQTTSWRLLRDEWLADPAALAEPEEWERNRSRVRPRMLSGLERFLAGRIGLEHFRSTFDQRTRADWDAFALTGASGAMFLNALVRHADHPVRLARQLRAALRLPPAADAAGSQLAEFISAVAPPALEFDTAQGPDVRGAPDTARGAPRMRCSRRRCGGICRRPTDGRRFSRRLARFCARRRNSSRRPVIRCATTSRSAMRSCRWPSISRSMPGSSSISAGGTRATLPTRETLGLAIRGFAVRIRYVVSVGATGGAEPRLARRA